MRKNFPYLLFAVIGILVFAPFASAQEKGQTPASAFPACGTTVFHQTEVPAYPGKPIPVPGCSGGGAGYADVNPFWYKFTCFQTGTLGFTITPNNLADDYDWQLFDITGRNPDDVYTDATLVVTGNWAGNPGPTGTSANGATKIQCASAYTGNEPRFARMPEIIVGHTYLLMVSHFTNDNQSGYGLSFSGGTAVITDPVDPLISAVKPDCEGKSLSVKFNKKMRCNTLTAAGSEFTISPALTNIASISRVGCDIGFEFDEVIIRLTTPLTNGDYQLRIQNGTDNNTILDLCDKAVPVNSGLAFSYSNPLPIFADSIGQLACAPDSLIIYYPRKIQCSTIRGNGSQFKIIGDDAPTIQSASGRCENGFSDIIKLTFNAPFYTANAYQLEIEPGIDGSPIMDACGLPILPQVMNFVSYDTVNAHFNIINDMGCTMDTLRFEHDGRNNVNQWSWTHNNTDLVSTQPIYETIWSATSFHYMELIVSNGICADTSKQTISLDHEVKAAFEIPESICPENPLQVINNSTGLIDSWTWTFGSVATSTDKDPQPFLFPPTNAERKYNISLTAYNSALNCTSSEEKIITVLSNCYIAVPSAFTPDGDGLNDYLQPNNAIKAENLRFKVFNRWGKLLFSSNDWRQKWDGKHNGIEQPMGVYVWYLEYNLIGAPEKIFQKGTTVLIR